MSSVRYDMILDYVIRVYCVCVRDQKERNEYIKFEKRTNRTSIIILIHLIIFIKIFFYQSLSTSFCTTIAII